MFEVKSRAAELIGMQPHRTQLIFNGRILHDDAILLDCGITEGSSCFLYEKRQQGDNAVHEIQEEKQEESETELESFSPPEYGSQVYWREKYQQCELEEKQHFDWYEDYHHKGIREIINKWIHKQARILVLGCGTSLLSEQMHQDGFRDITSIDYAGVQCLRSLLNSIRDCYRNYA